MRHDCLCPSLYDIVSQGDGYETRRNIVLDIEGKARAIKIWLQAERQELCGDDAVSDNDTSGYKLVRSEKMVRFQCGCFLAAVCRIFTEEAGDNQKTEK